jgi:DNA-binding transcriptional regulator GbsR (MarR family)
MGQKTARRTVRIEVYTTAMREPGIILTEGVVLGLFFVQRYRFLTIDQFARAAGMHRDTASRQLRSLELRGVLSHFGNACLPGHGVPRKYTS